MRIEWEDEFCIKVQAEQGYAAITANKAGLLSLAMQLTALAEEKPGSHLHYDCYNSLEDGSAELVIALSGKTDS